MLLAAANPLSSALSQKAVLPAITPEDMETTPSTAVIAYIR